MSARESVESTFSRARSQRGPDLPARAPARPKGPPRIEQMIGAAQNPAAFFAPVSLQGPHSKAQPKLVGWWRRVGSDKQIGVVLSEEGAPNLFGQLMSAPILMDACVSGHETFAGLAVYDIGEWYVRGEGDDVPVWRFYRPALGQAAMPAKGCSPTSRRTIDDNAIGFRQRTRVRNFAMSPISASTTGCAVISTTMTSSAASRSTGSLDGLVYADIIAVSAPSLDRAPRSM